MRRRSTYRLNSGTPSKESTHADSGRWRSTINGSARRGDLRRKRTASGRMPRAGLAQQLLVRTPRQRRQSQQKIHQSQIKKWMANFHWNACYPRIVSFKQSSATWGQPLLHRLQGEQLHSEWRPGATLPTARANPGVFPGPGSAIPDNGAPDSLEANHRCQRVRRYSRENLPSAVRYRIAPTSARPNCLFLSKC